jgi:hypothetical protein
MARIGIPVLRLRNLDRELELMLMEADQRCSTAFALRLDDQRERLVPALEAIAKSEARNVRKFADRDPSGKFQPTDQGALKFSTPEQMENLQEAQGELARSSLEIDEDILLPKLTKAELLANGLHASGQRLANLRPILDPASLDDPVAGSPNPRTVVVPPPPRGTPNA